MAAEPKGRRRGLRIGKYELSGPIAAWGAGFYRARDTEKERDVFVKLVPAEIANNPVTRERHQREAAKAIEFKLADNLQILDWGEANGTWYVAVEPLDVVGLDEYRAQRGTPTAEQTPRLLLQAARALQQADKRQLLPLEINPAGFIIAQRDGEPHLRWVPLSLLREARGEGQVNSGDYRAPELRRRGAEEPETRTAIYSLGAIFVQLLTGSWKPKDPDPTATLAGAGWIPVRDVLKRMIAPEPEDRFASWEDVIAELGPPALADEAESEEPQASQAVEETHPNPKRPPIDEGRRALADLGALAAAEAGDDAVSSTDDETDATENTTPARGNPMARRRMEDDDDADEAPSRPARAKTKPGAKLPGWMLPAAGAGVLVVVGIIVALAGGFGKSNNKVAKADDKKIEAPPVENKGDNNLEKKTETKAEVKNQGPPLLYPGAEKVDRAALIQAFSVPWLMPKEDDVLQVKPVAPLAKDLKAFDSIAAACAAAAKDKTTVILVHGNGPFFEETILIANKNILLRGAPGYRPLIVWDVKRLSKDELADPKREFSFLSAKNGKFAVANAELAVEWPEEAKSVATLIHVVDGDFLANDASLSVTGILQPATAIRFQANPTDARKCRLINCVFRGNQVALDVRAAAADILFEGSLLLGGAAPLIRVQAGASKAGPTIRVVRSSLFASETLISVEDSGEPGAKPALRFRGWDAFLARDRKEAGGTLLQLPEDASGEDCSWSATNCVYFNWKTLLRSKENIPTSDLASWDKRWNIKEGDKAISETIAVLDGIDSAEANIHLFRVDPPTRFAFAATYSPGILGCDFSRISNVRPYSRALVYRPWTLTPVPVLKTKDAPPIPKSEDGKYYGGRVELAAGKPDLAAFLREKAKNMGLGANVVLHLAGSGVQKFPPLSLNGVGLVLYFEQPKKGEPPLVLMADPPEAAPDNHIAYLQLDSGNLQIIGGDIRCPDDKFTKQIKYLIYVKNANIRITGAKLRGPADPPQGAFWGLVRLDGSGLYEPSKAWVLTLHQTSLLGGPLGLHFVGPGLAARLEDNLIASTRDAFGFELGQLRAERANVQCSLENNTIAVRQSVARITDTNPSLLTDPILIQSKRNAFEAPFEGPVSVVLYDNVAVPRGVVLWQSEEDAFDKRFRGYVVPSDKGKLPKLEAAQPFTAWERVFGPFGSVKTLRDVAFKGKLSAEKMDLDQLAPPPGLTPRVGADLQALGILAKKAETPKK